MWKEDLRPAIAMATAILSLVWLGSGIPVAARQSGQFPTCSPRRQARQGSISSISTACPERSSTSRTWAPGARCWTTTPTATSTLYLVQGHMLPARPDLADAMFPPRGRQPLTDRLYRNDLVAEPDGRISPRFVDVTDPAASPPPATAWGWPPATSTTTAGSTSTSPTSAPTSCGATTATAPSRTSPPRPAPTIRVERPRAFSTSTATAGSISTSATTSTSVVDRASCCSTRRPRLLRPAGLHPGPDRLCATAATARFEDVRAPPASPPSSAAPSGCRRATSTATAGSTSTSPTTGAEPAVDQPGGDGTLRERGAARRLRGQRRGPAEAAMGVDAADFDGDGDEDMFLTHLSRRDQHPLRQRGRRLVQRQDPGHRPRAPSWRLHLFGTAWFDYDNDGWLDLLIANGAVQVIAELALAGIPSRSTSPTSCFATSATAGSLRGGHRRRRRLRALRGQPRRRLRRPRQRRRHRRGDHQQQRPGAPAGQRVGTERLAGLGLLREQSGSRLGSGRPSVGPAGSQPLGGGAARMAATPPAAIRGYLSGWARTPQFDGYEVTWPDSTLDTWLDVQSTPTSSFRETDPGTGAIDENLGSGGAPRADRQSWRQRPATDLLPIAHLISRDGAAGQGQFEQRCALLDQVLASETISDDDLARSMEHRSAVHALRLHRQRPGLSAQCRRTSHPIVSLALLSRCRARGTGRSRTGPATFQRAVSSSRRIWRQAFDSAVSSSI